MKKIYFGSNLKMYKNSRDTVKYLQALVNATKDISRDNLELFIIPSYTSLAEAVRATDRSYVKLGAQNMCWEEQGQFTGEISPLMLRELGLDLVMVGHSERRQIFKETDQEENKKVLAALEHGFTVLLCVGETEEEKKYGITAEILRKQLLMGLYDVDAGYAPKIWVAYEPVWSIGAEGIPASPEYAEKMHQIIKKCLVQVLGKGGGEIPVLYGGSVNQENAEELIVQPSIDGLFIGRFAWQADKFDHLIRQALKSYDSSYS